MSSQDPLGREVSRLPEDCQWARSDDASRERWLRATVGALEARGYTITHTETALGVVSAERRTRLPGLGAANRPWLGFGSLWGGLGGSSGISVGYGMRFGDDPMEVERLSVVIDEETVSVTRDASVIDTDGYLADARPQNHPDFCRDLSASIDSRLRATEVAQ